jgi:hypothetical protein
MKEIYIEEAQEILFEQVQRVQEVCQNSSLTIEAHDSDVYLVYHFRSKTGHIETVRDKFDTTPF